MKELSLFEQELNEMGVKIIEHEKLESSVSYKCLHEYCEIKTHYSTYFKRNVAELFKEGSDYTLFKTEKRGLGKRIKRNKNYIFVPNENIADLILSGYVKQVGNQVKFCKEFADIINQFSDGYYPILEDIKLNIKKL